MIKRVAAVAAIAVSLGACASYKAVACNGPDDPSAGMKIEVPSEVAGLEVKREKDATKALRNATTPEETYACEGESLIYAMRDGDELRGVLQITRLAPDARMDDREFLSNLVRGITGSVEEPKSINGVDVYQTGAGGNEQIVSVWFQDRFMVFLTVREDPTFPGQVVGIDLNQVLSQTVGLPVVPA